MRAYKSCGAAGSSRGKEEEEIRKGHNSLVWPRETIGLQLQGGWEGAS